MIKAVDALCAFCNKVRGEAGVCQHCELTCGDPCSWCSTGLGPDRHCPCCTPCAESMVFDGETYDQEKDGHRLSGQLRRVWDVMCDHDWYTLAEIRAGTGSLDSEAGISARIRDLRKDKFGGFNVESRRRTDTLWEYSVRPPLESAPSCVDANLSDQAVILARLTAQVEPVAGSIGLEALLASIGDDSTDEDWS